MLVLGWASFVRGKHERFNPTQVEPRAVAGPLLANDQQPNDRFTPADRNFDAIANPRHGLKKRRIVAFDWLGQAGSSRPPFPYDGLRACS